MRIAFDTASPEGPFRTGDYWVFATRTADASVEHLEQAPARGIHHHYCRLALIEVSNDNQVTVSADCRQLFPHGLLAITTGEVLFESAPASQEVISGLIDSGLGSGPVCVVLGMAQTAKCSVVTLGHNAQALLTADVEPPSGKFKCEPCVRTRSQRLPQCVSTGGRFGPNDTWDRSSWPPGCLCRLPRHRPPSTRAGSNSSPPRSPARRILP